MLLSERPSQIQACFLERTSKGHCREENESGGAQKEVGRKPACHRQGRTEAERKRGMGGWS